jgi:hypothetical protein
MHLADHRGQLGVAPSERDRLCFRQSFAQLLGENRMKAHAGTADRWCPSVKDTLLKT